MKYITLYLAVYSHIFLFRKGKHICGSDMQAAKCFSGRRNFH